MTAGSDARAMAAAAMQFERLGRFDEAEAAYVRLLARWPALPECWFNLAVLQRRARRYEAALASYRQALDRGVTQPEEAHLNRGVIYSDCLRLDDEAEAELRAALALNPAYVPALLNLGNLCEDLGRRDEAGALYERALALDPGCHAALARLAGLRTATTPDPAMVTRLRQALSRPGLAAADQAVLGFALGAALDKAGQYEAAFAAYDEANRQSRASAGPAGVHYDRLRQERLVDALIATFDRPQPGRTPAVASPRPVFVCGMFRSGSTLVEQLLAGHPQVTAGGELDLVPALARRELAPFPAAMAGVSEQRLAQLARDYLATLARLYPGAEVVVDKRPDNFLYVGLIKRLFPDARIVHTRRDPLDNCLSVYFLHLDHSMPYALDLRDIGHYYRQYRRLMAHWRQVYGDDILDLDYDRLVREPQAVVAGLLDFCGLDWNDACLSFPARGNAVKTASVWQVRQPLYQHASGRARHYAGQLGPLAAELAETAVNR
jgi:tetratricopeptide (TPR) repeat protein